MLLKGGYHNKQPEHKCCLFQSLNQKVRWYHRMHHHHHQDHHHHPTTAAINFGQDHAILNPVILLTSCWYIWRRYRKWDINILIVPVDFSKFLFSVNPQHGSSQVIWKQRFNISKLTFTLYLL